MSRRRDGIRLSEKHGVNPSLGVCFFCGEDNGEVVLPGRLPGDAEAPRRATWHKLPCDACLGHMEKGVILISVRGTDDSDEQENPYRTGGWCVVRDEAVERWPLDRAVKDVLLQHRVGWIEDEMWDAIGLPRGAAE